MNIIKAILHNKCFEKFNKDNECKKIIDQFVDEKKYCEYLKNADQEYNKIDSFEIKAESKYLSVACASIIARYAFIEQIRNLSKKYNVNIPFGSSNEKIKKIANKLYILYGDLEMVKLVKCNFKTLEEIK